MNRQVRRTRQALHTALLDLIVDKGYDAVTVQDIIDRADVARSTFYAHYTDKQDLLRSGMTNLRAGLRQACSPGGQRLPLFAFGLELFRHCSRQRRLFRALVASPDAGPVLRWLSQVIVDLVREDLSALNAGHGPRVPPEVTVQFVAGSYLALLTWWLENEPPYSPEEMDRAFRELAVPATLAALDLPQPC